MLAKIHERRKQKTQIIKEASTLILINLDLNDKQQE
jgi:hypothetical protein